VAVFFGADAIDGWSLIGPGIIEGTAATSSGSNEQGINTRTCRRWLIQNLTIRYFKLRGICCNTSSYTSGDYGTGKVSTGRIIGCNVDLNNTGIGFFGGSEYISVVGCSFNNNLLGLHVQAANIKFNGCEANYNTDAISIVDGGNDGHGVWSGGMINHNTGFAVTVGANMDNGFTFASAHFFADSTTTNKIQSLGGGVVFSGCTKSSPIYASATPTGINSITGCFTPVGLVSAAAAVADLSAAERLKWIFQDNHSLTEPWANNDDRIYVYADDAAAGTGGLVAGRRYSTSAGELRIKL
jgi:hypothetical protein